MIMCLNDDTVFAVFHSAIILVAKSQEVAKILFELGNPKRIIKGERSAV